jgi:transposase
MRTFEVTDLDLEELFTGVMPHLDERQRRIVAGNVAMSLGRGGITAVAEASGMSRSTVQSAVGQIDAGVEVSDRVRAPGAGRRPITESQPGILQALDDLVEPTSRGCPTCPLRWTAKSTRTLAGELTRQGYTISHSATGNLLAYLGYSLQSPAKTREGASHPDRDGQFCHLAGQVNTHLEAGEPVISVDAKKKELVGNYANGGVEYEPKGEPVQVNGHDFPDPEISKAVPYGIYDLAANNGWVSVGDDGDTAEFAVASIARWWDQMGAAAYPDATRLLITADAGGSNSYRSRLWKRELAILAERTGLAITVCHFPPGTSKWNKIEHRMFNHISMNWRGRPLESYEVIVNLIANTTTRKGLTIHAEHDTGHYPTGIDIPAKDIKALQDNGQLTPHQFHGEWNYTIVPPNPTKRTNK